MKTFTWSYLVFQAHSTSQEKHEFFHVHLVFWAEKKIPKGLVNKGEKHVFFLHFIPHLSETHITIKLVRFIFDPNTDAFFIFFSPGASPKSRTSNAPLWNVTRPRGARLGSLATGINTNKVELTWGCCSITQRRREACLFQTVTDTRYSTDYKWNGHSSNAIDAPGSWTCC